tara:strand:+ start:197 stop:457 length:261 start_codon:yes stop_codon:yes gene_type:complete
MPGRKSSKKTSVKNSKVKKGVSKKEVGKVTVTLTCLKCKKKVEIIDFTKKPMKNGTMLVMGICPNGCKTKEGKPMKVSGFVSKKNL